MEITVQKYGGSSVADTSKLFNVCHHIINKKKSGKSVVVVVSAQGKTTDKLIEEEKEISSYVNKREHDVLVSVGEQITVSKIVMCLEMLGQKAVSYLGFQIPIITDSNYGDANIIKINPTKILKDLNNDFVVVVAGFQGIDKDNNITTLGRGGSDTTAIALAASLKASECEIFTDVDGVYDKDPNLDVDAIKYDIISYNKMLEMANNGAKVLHAKCIEMARDNNVNIVVKSSFKENDIGTLVTSYM